MPPMLCYAILCYVMPLLHHSQLDLHHVANWALNTPQLVYMHIWKFEQVFCTIDFLTCRSSHNICQLCKFAACNLFICFFTFFRAEWYMQHAVIGLKVYLLSLFWPNPLSAICCLLPGCNSHSLNCIWLVVSLVGTNVLYKTVSCVCVLL